MPRLNGREAEWRQIDPDCVKVSASKSEIRLPFRRLGEEGEEDRLRFFRTGEPAADGGEEYGRNHRCNAMRGVGWRGISVCAVGHLARLQMTRCPLRSTSRSADQMMTACYSGGKPLRHSRPAGVGRKSAVETAALIIQSNLW